MTVNELNVDDRTKNRIFDTAIYKDISDKYEEKNMSNYL